MKKLNDDTELAIFLVVMAVAMFWLLLIMAPAVARADSVYAGAWSLHKENHRADGVRYNETHYLFGYENDGWMGAGFLNSYNDPSVLIAKNYYLVDSDNVALSVGPALVWGYGSCYSGALDRKPRVCAGILPKIEYKGWGRVKPVLVYLGSAVALTFKVEI